jgi:ketosteroid isomerase-like protein
MPVKARAALIVLLALAACGGAPKPDAAAIERNIRDLNRQWNQHLTARNDSAITGFYAADGVLLPPNEPRVTGSDNIRQYWAGLWAANAALALNVERVTASASGDLAVEEGTWKITVPMPQGEVKDDGKYLVVWAKDGPNWRVKLDMWNSNNPPPPPSPPPPVK